jgi:hypothetical protein
VAPALLISFFFSVSYVSRAARAPVFGIAVAALALALTRHVVMAWRVTSPPLPVVVS